MNFANINLGLVAATVVLVVGCQTTESIKTATKSGSLPDSGGAILRYNTVHHPVIARDGMVVSQNTLASRVGRSILAEGGNAVDAAVAVGFALAVMLPRAGNIGGSGFMLIHHADDKKPYALDFRSIAPEGLGVDEFKDENGEFDWERMTFGPKAAGVPGTVAGFYHAWEKFGSLKWARLLEPAIKLASGGIRVSNDLAFVLKQAEPVMSRYSASVETYLIRNGAAPHAGDMLVQNDLAWSLNEIAIGGADAFYTGSIAEKIDAYMQANGGHLTKNNLKSYRVEERQPITTEFYGHKVVTMPPASSGGITILQLLNILKELNIAAHPAGSAESLHLIAEAMKRTAANRRVGIGDPNFVDVAIEKLISNETAAGIAKDISITKARPVEQITPIDANPYESRETTHYSIVDGQGNAVSTTYTLGYSFGSGVVVPGTGILLDNQIKNFTYNKGEHANRIEAGKRMISTMSPTFVLDDSDKVVLVTGSPGGSRIPNVVAQLIINTVLHKMNIAQATHAPRIHQQWRTPQLGVENGISVDTVELLKLKGHIVEHQPTMGSTQSIVVKNGYVYGAADPRRPGAIALGYDAVKK